MNKFKSRIAVSGFSPVRISEHDSLADAMAAANAVAARRYCRGAEVIIESPRGSAVIVVKGGAL
jgi:hypothetical protein